MDKATRLFLVKLAEQPSYSVNLEAPGTLTGVWNKGKGLLGGVDYTSPDQMSKDLQRYDIAANTPEWRQARAQMPDWYVRNLEAAQQAANTWTQDPAAVEQMARGTFSPAIRINGQASPNRQFNLHNLDPNSPFVRRLKAQGATTYASNRINNWTAGLGMGSFGKGLNSVLQFLLRMASRTPGYSTVANWAANRFMPQKQSNHILPPPYAHYRSVARLPDGSEVLSPWNRS